MNFFKKADKKIKNPNVQFYLGKKVYDYTLQDMYKWGQKNSKYDILESKHDYIQWLFPSPQRSVFNSDSYALSQQEMKEMRENKEIAQNFVKSYKMMLDFYGIQMVNDQTGKLVRAENYKDRYRQAIGGHNLLRICRILTCLTCVGFRRYAVQLTEHFRYEIYDTQELKRRDVKNSFDKFYLHFGINYDYYYLQRNIKNEDKQIIDQQMEEVIDYQKEKLSKSTLTPLQDLEIDSVFFTKESKQEYQQEEQQIIKNYITVVEEQYKQSQILQQKRLELQQQQQQSYNQENQQQQQGQNNQQQEQNQTQNIKSQKPQKNLQQLQQNGDQNEQQEIQIENEQQEMQIVNEQQEIQEEKSNDDVNLNKVDSKISEIPLEVEDKDQINKDISNHQQTTNLKLN